MAKTTSNNSSDISSNINISMKLRMILVRCCVWSVLMYGCEVWTLDKRMKRRKEGCEYVDPEKNDEDTEHSESDKRE